MMTRNCQMPQHAAAAAQPAGCQTSRPACPCGATPQYKQMNRVQLMKYLNEVSFAVDDILLYLDTHPCDREALSYSRDMIARRCEALEEYSLRFGPLTIDKTVGCDGSNWEWIMQPWPWETSSKGGCR